MDGKSHQLCSRLSRKGPAQPMNSVLTLVAWWGPAALQAGIAYALVGRKLYRELPIFFVYTLFQIARSVALYFLDPHGWPYFYGYWGTEVLSWALGLAVIQEAVQQLLKPYEAVHRLVTILFRWAAGLLIATAVLTAYEGPGAQIDGVLANILILERGVRIVQVGLLSLLFVFARLLRLRWPHYVFGIALGFAIFTSVELTLVTMRSQNIWTHSLFATLSPIAFVVAQGVWLNYLAVPERVPASAPQPAPQMEGWNGALAELWRR